MIICLVWAVLLTFKTKNRWVRGAIDSFFVYRQVAKVFCRGRSTLSFLPTLYPCFPSFADTK
jgi:hypothetical protein